MNLKPADVEVGLKAGAAVTGLVALVGGTTGAVVLTGLPTNPKPALAFEPTKLGATPVAPLESKAVLLKILTILITACRVEWLKLI